MKRRDSQVRYKQALKDASSRWNESIKVRRKAEKHTNYSTSLKSSLNDIKVQSCQAIVDDINKTLQKDDQKITKTTVQQYVKKGLVKDSPLKKGPVQRMPLTLFNAARLHIKMKQLGRSKQATP